MKTLIKALVALVALATVVEARPYPHPTFDGSGFGPADIKGTDGPAFGPKELVTCDGPAHAANEGGNQR